MEKPDENLFGRLLGALSFKIINTANIVFAGALRNLVKRVMVT
jgi:hypothetical protein